LRTINLRYPNSTCSNKNKNVFYDIETYIGKTFYLGDIVGETKKMPPIVKNILSNTKGDIIIANYPLYYTIDDLTIVSYIDIMDNYNNIYVFVKNLYMSNIIACYTFWSYISEFSKKTLNINICDIFHNFTDIYVFDEYSCTYSMEQTIRKILKTRSCKGGCDTCSVIINKLTKGV
jgi:hypothetical protein